MNETTLRHLLRIFVTGLLAALPLAATVLIFVWGARLLYDWLGPGSLVGDVLVGIGLGVTGSEVVGYGIGVGVVLLAIFALGLVVRTRLRHVLAVAVRSVMKRIPLVRTVYELLERFVALMSQRDGSGMNSMSPVWLRFGGGDGEGDGSEQGQGPGQGPGQGQGQGQAMVLGLLSAREPVVLNGQPYLAVLIPTAPVPVGGMLIYVPQRWVSPAEVGVEGLTSIYVSMGVTSAQQLGKGR